MPASIANTPRKRRLRHGSALGRITERQRLALLKPSPIWINDRWGSPKAASRPPSLLPNRAGMDRAILAIFLRYLCGCSFGFSAGFSCFGAGAGRASCCGAGRAAGCDCGRGEGAGCDSALVSGAGCDSVLGAGRDSAWVCGTGRDSVGAGRDSRCGAACASGAGRASGLAVCDSGRGAGRDSERVSGAGRDSVRGRVSVRGGVTDRAS